jgi:hypothetical protein
MSGLSGDSTALLSLLWTHSAPWATTFVIVGAHRDGLQLGRLDQTERDAYIVKPFLEFAVHITPPSGKYSAANVRTA